MKNIDWVTMLGNLSQALGPMQKLVGTISFLVGISFCVTAMYKFHKVADYRPMSRSQEHALVALAYLLGGVFLIHISSTISTASATLFGLAPNLLQYSQTNPYDLRRSLRLLIQFAGIVWAARGLVLMVHSTERGVNEGLRGVSFFIAGILAVNFEQLIRFLNWATSKVVTWSIVIRTKTGY